MKFIHTLTQKITIKKKKYHDFDVSEYEEEGRKATREKPLMIDKGFSGIRKVFLEDGKLVVQYYGSMDMFVEHQK